MNKSCGSNNTVILLNILLLFLRNINCQMILHLEEYFTMTNDLTGVSLVEFIRANHYYLTYFFVILKILLQLKHFKYISLKNKHVNFAVIVKK